MNSSDLYGSKSRYSKPMKNFKVTLEWAPGRTGVQGNEETVNRARNRASTRSMGLMPLWT